MLFYLLIYYFISSRILADFRNGNLRENLVVNNKTRATISARISVPKTINFNIVTWCTSYYYYPVPTGEYNAAGSRNNHYSSELFRNPFVPVACYVVYYIGIYIYIFIYVARARPLLLFIITYIPLYIISSKWAFIIFFLFGIAFTLVRGLVVCGIVNGILFGSSFANVSIYLSYIPSGAV